MILPTRGVRDCDFVSTYDENGRIMSRCFGNNNHCFVSSRVGAKCACGRREIKDEGIFDAVVN